MLCVCGIGESSFAVLFALFLELSSVLFSYLEEFGFEVLGLGGWSGVVAVR